MRSRILYLSGRHDDARQLSLMLEGLPMDVDHSENLQQARAMLRQIDYHVILSEASLPDGTWLDSLLLSRECARNLKLIVTDPHADARFWAEALNLGAYDVLAQPFYSPEVRRILYNACARPAESPEVQHLVA
jgi:DNA-binding NtrC family response regulator